MAYIFMAYKWGVILTTYDTWEPILQATPPPTLVNSVQAIPQFIKSHGVERTLRTCQTESWNCSKAGMEKNTPMTGGGNSKIFGIFTPKIGEDEPNLTSIFFRWAETTN